MSFAESLTVLRCSQRSRQGRSFDRLLLKCHLQPELQCATCRLEVQSALPQIPGPASHILSTHLGLSIAHELFLPRPPAPHKLQHRQTSRYILWVGRMEYLTPLPQPHFDQTPQYTYCDESV